MNRMIHKLILIFGLVLLTTGICIRKDTIWYTNGSQLYAVQGDYSGVDKIDAFIRSIELDDIDLKYGKMEYLYREPLSFSAVST